MKKISLLGLCLFAIGSASAQNDIVKQVDRALKAGNVDYAAAREQIAPALTNPETKESAYAWYTAGKLEFDAYDNMLAKKQLGQEASCKEMGKALIDGYNIFMKAMPFDQIPNEKGKVKPKYTKSIVNTIGGHFNDYHIIACDLWGAEDFKGAYDAWAIYLDLGENPAFAKAMTVPHDTIMGEIAYNKALAAWKAEMLDEALQAFEYAKNKGYNKKAVYDYAISVAALAQKNDVVYALAAEGYKYYGKEDPKFIQLIINGYIEKQDYEQANAMLDEAIAAEPGNAVYYNLKGVICESQKDNETALEFYQKATEIDATLASAFYNYGRKLCEKAYGISDSSAELSQAEYNKVRAEQIDPLLKLAAEQLEKAFQLDEENQRDALRYLRNVYYNLGDDENLKRIDELM